MKSSTIRRAAIACALAVGTIAAHAADFHLAGNSVFDTDVVKIGFSLDTDSTNVNIWTDSWQSGLNYDPVVAVWEKTGSGYALINQVDDDDTIGAGQGAFDSGLHFDALASGQYLVTLAASPNYANGSMLSDGFNLDGTTPVAIKDWNQPGYDLNANDQKGTFWSVNLSGVDQVAAVPEPETWALLALGLIACAAVNRRRARS